MPRKSTVKAKKNGRKTSRKPASNRRPVKQKTKPAARRAAAPAQPVIPMLSREVVEELLVHSARSGDGETLSDKALVEIALSAGLDPEKLLDAHRQLCEAADEPDITVLRVVELWDPYE